MPLYTDMADNLSNGQGMYWTKMPIIRNFILAVCNNKPYIEKICSAAGMSMEDLENPEATVSLQQNCEIMEMGLQMTQDDYLGLRVGQITSPTVLGTAGHLMQTSKDLLSALQNVQQFTLTFTNQSQFNIAVDRNKVYMHCLPCKLWTDISPLTARHSVDLSFAASLHILRILTGYAFKPVQVMYQYPAVPDTREYEKVFSCLPLFNQHTNCMVFSLEDMRTPIVGYNKELHDVLSAMLERQLSQVNTKQSFISQLKEAILKNYQFSFPLIEDVASQMNMSARTLQRRLQEEGSSFSALENDIKKEMALSFLEQSKLPVPTIAYKLGYREASSFQRAFKTWTGVTPSAYKKRRRLA